MNRYVKQWMVLATAQEQAALATAAGTSRGHLYQLSSGERNAGPALARRIETASKTLRKTNKALPVLHRAEVCEACSDCEFAARCRR